MLFQPFSTSLASFTDERRRPSRPTGEQGPDFESQFDNETLFYDAFRSHDGSEIVLVGPPFLNLAPMIRALEARDRASGALLTTRIRHLDRHAQIRVSAPAGVSSIILSSPMGRVAVDVGPGGAALFAGRRVLMTMSRDNPLAWIADWIRFNRDIHGADAVLLYDNGSTLYPIEVLHEAIGAVRGIAAVGVVSWPFKYGPQGTSAALNWDSDFAQLGAWEDARWRFLAQARSVMNADIDELLPAGSSVFEAAERSSLGIVRYHGRWIVDATGEAAATEPADRRHRQFGAVLRRRIRPGRFCLPVDADRCQPKWTIVPGRCPPGAQWHVHRVRGWLAAALTRPGLRYRHFRPISTSWKYGREAGRPLASSSFEEDRDLARAMARVDWTF